METENKDLKCTQCGIVKKYYCEIVYSQGEKVCTDCKELNSESDKKAYDRYITSRS